MGKNLLDHHRVFDAGNHFHGATAGTTGLEQNTLVSLLLRLVAYYSGLLVVKISVKLQSRYSQAINEQLKTKVDGGNNL